MWQSLVAAVAGIGMMFGGASSTGDHRPAGMDRDRMMGSTTREMHRDGENQFEGRGASSTAAANLPCVAAAVAAREATLGTGATQLANDTSAAYSARASALAAAYSQSNADAVKAAVKTVWDQFKGAMQAARKAWQSSRSSAWSGFKAAVKACGNGSTSVSDAGNAGSEVSGQ